MNIETIYITVSNLFIQSHAPMRWFMSMSQPRHLAVFQIFSDHPWSVQTQTLTCPQIFGLEHRICQHWSWKYKSKYNEYARFMFNDMNVVFLINRSQSWCLQDWPTFLPIREETRLLYHSCGLSVLVEFPHINPATFHRIDQGKAIIIHSIHVLCESVQNFGTNSCDLSTNSEFWSQSSKTFESEQES